MQKMTHTCRLVLALVLVASTQGSAQAVLRPGASGRGTSEVTLSYPRPAAAMPATAATPAPARAASPAAAPMSNMAGMAGMAGTTPAPAAKPLGIRLDYGQPHLRGRSLHTDSLLPYDKPWRLGANGVTTLTTDVDLVLGGATIAKGTYVLYTVPSRTTWKLVVQRNVGQSPMVYVDSSDVARVDLQHTMLASSIESLTMWLIPSLEPGPAKGELRFAWGTDQLTVPWSVKQ